ncbi:hypothetical protein B6A27_18020 [Anoxybacillus sp. UARK-01]|nr:hypothetical protein B6A27_18020 [Anoxybacillus sp. UARK-01]
MHGNNTCKRGSISLFIACSITKLEIMMMFPLECCIKAFISPLLSILVTVYDFEVGGFFMQKLFVVFPASYRTKSLVVLDKILIFIHK